MKKQFILDLIENWIVAVCETKQEAMLTEKLWASAILLVNHRWEWKNYSSPNSELILDITSSLQIPIFVRVRHWHFAEAQIAQEAWADAIIESFYEKNWIKNSIKKEDFIIPIISEIKKIEEIKDKDEINWSFFLLLWEYWSWNIVPLVKKINKWNIKKYWKIFAWWWIASPADLKLLDKKKVKWFFIWTALFHFNTKDYFQEAISLTK